MGRPGKSLIATRLPIARVWVDTGVYHLDTPYDYFVPEMLSSQAQVGVRVEVPFGPSLQEGIIVERLPQSANAGSLKEISKVLSPHPVATAASLKLIDLAARHWAGAPYDILRSAIPPRVRSADKEVQPGAPSVPSFSGGAKLPAALSQRKVRAFWSLPPATSAISVLSQLIETRVQFGQVLVIFPDERGLSALEALLSEHFGAEVWVRIDAHLSRSSRYRNYLKAVNGESRIVLALRGGVFTPLGEGATLIIVGESAHLLHEPRTPGWNARDVAVLRAQNEEINLLFLGYSPSLESARLIDTGWLTLITSKEKRSVLALAPSRGELIPSQVYSLVRKALKVGPVLFLAPRKGYGNAVLCNKCRNIALCTCGGRLQRNSAFADPQCVICASRFSNWRCAWCQSPDIYIASRGIDRFAEEIGRSFPNFPIVNSSGDHIVDQVPDTPALIVATPGATPYSVSGYAAVILLQGMRFFGHSDLRSAERAREIFFETAALISHAGEIAVVIDSAHPIVAALTLWDPTTMVRRELQEQAEARLPPYSRIVLLEMESKEAMSIYDGLIRARSDKRIPPGSQILGPHQRSNGVSRITLSAPVSDAEQLVEFVHELQRRRSISRKPLFSIRVDPYSLG
jgi:primosomal protein N' (replication factor Y)